MKSAKEMFEELGFKQTENDDSFIEYQRDDGDQHAEITFSLKDKNFRAIYGRYEFGMSFHYVTSDELKAIVCQAKELGWIELEQKPETNFAHYYNDLLKIGWNSNFGVTNGKIKHCNNVDCGKCYIGTLTNEVDCGTNAIKWLASPYKKPLYKLTKFEYDLLNAYKDSGMLKSVSSYSAMHELHEKGYFKDIDFSIPIHKILENYEIKGEEKND